MFLRILSLVALFVALLLVALAGLAAARPPCHDEKDRVKVTLIVVLASEKGTKIDKQLKLIAEEVQKLNPNFKSFTLKHMESRSLKPGEKVSWPCVEKEVIAMLIKHCADKDNRVGLSVNAPMMKEIEYQTVCGKFLPIVTPYTTKKNERLILAIRVQPCRGE
ncbi:MAG: hypothetical protein EXR98_10725 [Gemmataceae bacterium]|nr:hypothetical protein [Gemmataceae bacterium]